MKLYMFRTVPLSIICEISASSWFYYKDICIYIIAVV